MTDDEQTTLSPPADLGAERQILGAALLNPKVIDDVDEIVRPADFYRPAHESIWSTILRLHHDREPVDAGIVKDRLTASGELTKAGGAAYLFELIQGTLTATNASHHAAVVARTAGQRRIIEAGTRIAQIGYGSDGQDLVDTQERARAEIDAATGSQTASTVQWVGDTMSDTLEALESEPDLMATPWLDVDHILGGWAPGRLYVVGARPGVGKTILGVQAAQDMAIKHGRSVVMASLEMSRHEINLRVLSQLAAVPYNHLERHQLTADDWSKLAKVQGVVSDMRMSVMDRSAIRVADIRRYARSVSRHQKLGLIVVDYLQLMSSPPGRQQRHEVIAEFSRGLKLLAQELEVPVLAMSQLNRASEQRTNKLPALSDLRESGAVEQDADVVMLLHRDLEAESPRAGEMDIAVAKNRHGTTGVVTLAFQGHYQRAVSMAWTPSTALGRTA